MGSTVPGANGDDSPQITLALEACASGNSGASDELFRLVYDGLRHLARNRMKAERAGDTLQPTALVHEAYLRLVGSGPVSWQSRGHFFAAAGGAMRRILVERARSRARHKRGGDGKRAPGKVQLSELTLAVEPEPESMLMLNDALERFEREDPQSATIVHLRFFAGLSVEETAEALGVSARTIDRDWAFARARLLWLMRSNTP
ncbi:MAG: sigma-70 family RNA polymerase sigma factor [Phycisphaerales bacterium]